MGTSERSCKLPKCTLSSPSIIRTEKELEVPSLSITSWEGPFLPVTSSAINLLPFLVQTQGSVWTKGKSIPALESPRQGCLSGASCLGPSVVAPALPKSAGCGESGLRGTFSLQTRGRVAEAAHVAVLFRVLPLMPPSGICPEPF